MRVVVAGLLTASLVCTFPVTSSSQQLQNIFRNLMQNVAPSVGQPPAPSTNRPPPSPAYYSPAYRPSAGASAQTTVQVSTSAIMAVQRMLDELGYDAGAADGAWGERSAQALRSFEREHDLRPDGVVNAASQMAVSDAWSRRSVTQTGNTDPSFPCSRASNASEVTICRRPDLAALDRQLANVYLAKRQTATGSAAANLQIEQREWQTRRNGCGANDLCLRTAMTERIAQLQTPMQSNTGLSPGTLDSSPQLEAHALPVAPVASGDPLASLVNPPTGLPPWHLDRIDGHIVVSYQKEFSPTDRSNDCSPLGWCFFHLLALTLPDAIEHEASPSFLMSLLDEGGVRAVFGSHGPMGAGQWGGGNELEYAASRRVFLERYAPLIRAMAPKPPFILHWTEAAMLRQYDEQRGGFAVRPVSPDPLAPLALVSAVSGGGLVPAPGFTVPNLFWKVDPAKAEDVLRRWPERILEFQATVEIGEIDPVSKEVPLKLLGLSLHEPKHGPALYDYPVAPSADEAPEVTSERTASIALPAPADEAEAVRRWNLPTRGGLPWIDGRDYSAVELNTPYDFQSYQPHPNGPTTHEKWSRAIHALALSTSSAPTLAALSDSDMARLACIFLPIPTQMKMFGQDACQFQPSVPQAPFELKDGAAAFRAQELPRILAQAPRLPFRLLLVIPANLDTYDAARGGFKVKFQLYTGGQERLFGSRLDVPLPNFWPTTEAEARRYSATQTQPFVRSAWLGVTVTITGTTPGQGSAHQIFLATGLPKDAGWRFHTDSAVLYLDASLRSPLHDFTSDLVRPPEPVLGTSQEQAPGRPEWATAAAANNAATATAAAQNALSAKAKVAAAQAAASVASVRQVAAGALGGVPYGPDVDGLRLGMKMADAAAVIRANMAVGTVYEAETDPGAANERSMGLLHVFIAKDSSETITLLEGPTGTVLGIERTAAVAEGFSDAQLSEQLRTKYGPPRSTAQQHWTWGADTLQGCAQVRSGVLTGIKVQDGALPRIGFQRGGFVFGAPSPGGPPLDLTQWAACQPELDIFRYNDKLAERLFDIRTFAVEQADQQAAQARSAAPPKL